MWCGWKRIWSGHRQHPADGVAAELLTFCIIASSMNLLSILFFGYFCVWLSGIPIPIVRKLSIRQPADETTYATYEAPSTGILTRLNFGG